MARGYNQRLFGNKSTIQFEEIFIISGNYLFPIAFPDWDIGSLAYFKSVSVNAFYDYSVGFINNTETLMRSTGMDVNFEITTLRLLLTSFTLRTLYRFDLPDPQMKNFYFKVVLNIRDLAF